MKKILFALATLLLLTQQLPAQHYEPNWASLNKRGIPAWFHKAKFGIFIHWGVYSVPAFAPVIPNSGYSYAEWYWNRLESKDMKGDTAVKNFHARNYGRDFPYRNFEKSFRAELFNPAQWAEIFRESGARYVVLTSKHHEGYCLWNSPWADRSWGRPWNAVTGTPHRDLLGDLTQAVKDAGLRMGYYYSLYEWFNPLWKTDKQRYIREVMTPEFKDLVTRYKPSIIFSDGEWELPDTAWHSPELLAWLFNESPVAKEVVVNDRWGSNTRGKNTGSTYSTSEYGSGMGPDVTWEESQGIGLSYGYNRMEALKDYKSSRQLILILADIVSRGGNLLLDIGPTADGRIPVIMQQRLLDIGSWLKTNGEAIYATTPWKATRQWSAGKRPEVKKASYMAAYDISKLVVPRDDQAHIEMFFTRKGNDLYCILPNYMPVVSIRNFSPPASATVSLAGSSRKISWKQNGENCEIDLSGIRPGDISLPFVIRVENGLPEGKR
ncbi:alpha-L-fucosidase [Compostibacter hankyongensis]|uniref:alpha-L-fucosidase n=1 Tax=Compostibacter hankyongensis TaxID=1007089 RepID=A0ABP8FE82_9BACT